MRFTKLLTVSEVGLKFLKFAMNLAISFRSCQSNRDREFHAKLRWEVIKFIAREVHAIQCSWFDNITTQMNLNKVKKKILNQAMLIL